jgi:hypothetical protein
VPSITRSDSAARLIDIDSARRTRRSSKGLEGSGLPSLSLVKGTSFRREWSITR